MTKDITPELLALMACPKCKSPVRQVDDDIQCLNFDCGLCYPVRKGIPIMLIEEAVEERETTDDHGDREEV